MRLYHILINILFLIISLHSEKVKVNKIKTIQFKNYKNKYCVYYNYWKSTIQINDTINPRITLVLHATMDYIEYLAKQIKIWEGPISIAIVIPKPKKIKCKSYSKHLYCAGFFKKEIIYFEILKYFEMLYDIRKISLHLIFEKDNFKKCPFVFLFGMSRDRWRVLKNYKTSINKIKKLPKLFDVYPINVARNIGRLGKTTELFLSGDIENYASYRYESKVSKLANQLLLKDKKRAVLVHRRFEIDNNITIPRTKYELEKLYINKKSFVFHTFFYIQGHYIPGLNKWFKVPENYVNTSIFNIINYTQPDWEPQFVGDDRVPYHDERFPYRIRSNTHLAHIMCHQQFKFIILNDVFTIHEGIKRGYKKYEETAANTSLTSTRKIIFHFNDFLKKKYPHMSGVCPRLRI